MFFSLNRIFPLNICFVCNDMIESLFTNLCKDNSKYCIWRTRHIKMKKQNIQGQAAAISLSLDTLEKTKYLINWSLFLFRRLFNWKIMIELNEKSKITCALVTVPFDIKTYDLFSTSQHDITRSSHPEIFFRKGVLINFAKFTGKHLRQSLFFNQVDLRFATLLKKKTLIQVFSCNFYEISKNTFFTEHLRVTASNNISIL